MPYARIEDRKANQRAYREKRGALERERVAEWRRNNPDLHKKCQEDSYKKHADKRRHEKIDYRKANLELVRQQDRDRHQRHQEKRNAASRSWSGKNKDWVAAYNAAWNAANPEKKSAKQAKRRAQKASSGGTHTDADIKALILVQKNKCAHIWCKKVLSAGYHVDHIMPLSLGGSNDKKNIQLLCETCNLKKGARHPVEFALMNGLLL